MRLVVDIRNNRKPKEQKPERSAAAVRTEPTEIDWGHADPEKWQIMQTVYDGSFKFNRKPQMEEIVGPIEQGKAKLRMLPVKYQGILYQTSMLEWPEAQQKYTLIMRAAKAQLRVTPCAEGAFSYLRAVYCHLPGICIAQAVPDAVTDSILHSNGYQQSRLAEPLYPGRGKGCGDVPTLNLLRNIDPFDVQQGQVGDCWLLSAISALAEYEGAISHLFSKTAGDVQLLPSHEHNNYTITLWDLPTGEQVDITVDERLCSRADGSGVLGASPTLSGDLWCCYLEKAMAVHCGGWDKINGGQCSHAWRMLTGCQEQYTIQRLRGEFRAMGAFNPKTHQMEKLENSPHDSWKGAWTMPWPEVGGGGGAGLGLSENELFERMCAWDDAGFVMAAGTRQGSDSQHHEGIVDGHAYTILDCENDVAGTEFDLIKVRNPWGRKEFVSGRWDDDGPGWEKYPEVKAALNPVVLDDGIFWVDKDEFFHFFSTIYLCARDMATFTGQNSA